MARKRIVSNLHQLTVREVLAAGDGDHTDGGGLLLRVRGESASWVFRYTAATSKRREMGMGVARRGSAAQAGDGLTLARGLAHAAREQLALGVDPIDDRDGKRAAAQAAESAKKSQAKRARMTLARAARAYHERVIEPSRTDKHAAQWIASLEHHVPPDIWHAPIDSVTPPALLAALSGLRALADSEEHIPETLQRVRQRLDAVFEDAIFHGLCPTNPAAAIRRKMAEGQTRRERGQHAALPYREAAQFMQRLREQQGIGARCLELAMLTAARTGEVLGATWPEFDLDAALWTIPAERMKGGELHTVHLVPRAVELLREQMRLGSPFVFPSPVLADSPLSNMGMLTLLKRMKMQDRTPSPRCWRNDRCHFGLLGFMRPLTDAPSARNPGKMRPSGAFFISTHQKAHQALRDRVRCDDTRPGRITGAARLRLASVLTSTSSSKGCSSTPRMVQITPRSGIVIESWRQHYNAVRPTAA